MIVDGRQLQSGQVIESDICIVGSGAAGITVAEELKVTGLQSVVLESGGVRLETDIQDLDRGDVVDSRYHPTLDRYRRRQFGGATNIWSGRCAPLDAVDFSRRSHVPGSGWPISREELDPYYERAHAYCDLGEYSYSVSEALPDARRCLIPGLQSEDISMDKVWRYSPPTNFRKKYASSLKHTPHVRVLLHTTCLKLMTDPSGRRVTEIMAASAPGRELIVRAREYVLAAGCLEATRLLLLSNDVNPNGLGNDFDLVGRFYMSHFHGICGEIRIDSRGLPVTWDYEQTEDGTYCKRMITIRDETKQAAQLLGFSAILSPPELHTPRHRNGVLSAKYLANRVMSRIAPGYNASIIKTSDESTTHHFSEHLKNILIDGPHVLSFAGMWTTKKLTSQRKPLALGLRRNCNVYALEFDAEQAPNCHSRLVLDDKKDAFGLRRLKLDWRTTALDVLSTSASIKMISEALTKSGLGNVDTDPDMVSGSTLRMATGGHHIGTTRMAATPSQGVVDEHCRVHPLGNLHIASSSVFPTSGYANPTLTVLALAIRLADRLQLAHTS